MLASLLKKRDYNSEDIEWFTSKVKTNNVLCAFIDINTFCGTFASSFNSKLKDMVSKREDISSFLSDFGNYFPELDDVKEKDEAYRWIEYECQTYRLMLRDYTLNYEQAWALYAYKKEKDIVSRILSKPYSNTVFIRHNNINKCYYIKDLIQDIKNGKIKEDFYQLERQLC
jgi:hypothetical protein